MVAVSEGGRPVVDGRAARWHETSSGWVEEVGGRRVPVIPGGPSLAATKLPAGQLFLLSDARPIGGDSRVHGMIREDAILGAISTSSPD